MRGGAQQCELDAGHGGREVGECRGGRMLRSPVAAGGRSEGGGAKRRFMDGVGKDMKLVAVRKKKAKGGGNRRRLTIGWGRLSRERPGGRRTKFAVLLSCAEPTRTSAHKAP